MLNRPLGPGALAERLASLRVEIDGLSVERGSAQVAGYYDGAPRPIAIAILQRGEKVGRGECVAWTEPEQDAFVAACGRLDLAPDGTLEDLSFRLAEDLDDPYHRAAVEGAAIDLALRQADTNMFRLAERPAVPVRFCRSIGRSSDPLAAMAPVLAETPDPRFKLDVPPEGWSAATWQALAGTRRVVILDFKRESDLDQLRLAHRAIPEAWLEDPPSQAITLDPHGDWLERVSLDGYVLAAVDLDDPEIPPAAINVKAPRVGGWLEALRCLEECRRRDLRAYVGGMFEVDVGRSQARVLASLFTADAWNDLAPLVGTSHSDPDDRQAGFGTA